MKKINSTAITIIFIFLFLLVGLLLYQTEKNNAVTEAEHRIEIFMKKWLALFDYVEVHQKNVFYDLEKEGLLKIEGYFNPKVLSFTYIARQIQNKYEELEKANGNIPYRYRLAATTPRNPINLATKHEAEILERFRNDEISKFVEYTSFEGEKFYTSYTPIKRTTETCMRCHSEPEKAPKGLVKLYGNKKGFGESVGMIRGMVITEIPFSEIEAESFKRYIKSMLLVSLIFTLFTVVINTLINKEQALNQTNAKLEKLSTTDKLTNIANRRSFIDHLQQQWDLQSSTKKTLSLILCEIDYFDLYKDNQNSDKCLKHVANAISIPIRQDDNLVARYEGEIFAIVLSGSDSPKVLQLAEAIQEEVSKIDFSPAITLSIGLCTTHPYKNNSYEEFISKVEYLLGKAKKDGRNCIRS